MAHGEIQHVEFPADDLGRAQRFYHELFGWEMSPMEGFEGYLVFRTSAPGAPSSGTGGGIGTRNQAVAESVVVYVTVDSIDQTLGRLPELGGSVRTGKTEIPGFGWYALIIDSEGSLLGLYEIAPQG